MRKSRILTSEPMLTRALAAEIRAEPENFRKLLKKKFNLETSQFSEISIECEAKERLDILISFSSPDHDKTLKVGIEAKLNHEITESQILREKSTVDFLYLLVLELEDSDDFKALANGVITWKEALTSFNNPRISLQDVENIPSQKVQIERLFRALRPAGKFPENWEVQIVRSGAGMPSIQIEAPYIDQFGAQIRGQIQVVGRKMPDDLQDVRLEYHIGISHDPDSSEDFFDPTTSNEPPAWIMALQELNRLISQRETSLEKRNSARNGKTPLTQYKIPLVDKFLGRDKRWMAVGYSGWSYGIKSEPVETERLPELLETTVELFTGWQNILESTTKATTVNP